MRDTTRAILWVIADAIGFVLIVGMCLIMLFSMGGCATHEVDKDWYANLYWDSVVVEDYSSGDRVLTWNPDLPVGCAAYWEREYPYHWQDQVIAVHNHCTSQTGGASESTVQDISWMYPTRIDVRVQ